MNCSTLFSLVFGGMDGIITTFAVVAAVKGGDLPCVSLSLLLHSESAVCLDPPLLLRVLVSMHTPMRSLLGSVKTVLIMGFANLFADGLSMVTRLSLLCRVRSVVEVHQIHNVALTVPRFQRVVSRWGLAAIVMVLRHFVLFHTRRCGPFRFQHAQPRMQMRPRFRFQAMVVHRVSATSSRRKPRASSPKANANARDGVPRHAKH